MRFDPKGIVKGKELDDFRQLWMQFTLEENSYMAGKETDVSPMQKFTIDMFTGNEDPYLGNAEMAISGDNLAQMELESVFRGRSRALAISFQMGKQI